MISVFCCVVVSVFVIDIDTAHPVNYFQTLFIVDCAQVCLSDISGVYFIAVAGKVFVGPEIGD